mmetsp:Transcript_5196/g.19333  ORF Transcript_5196/g.19333 Transcript_5196/m.19333 type:complete len:289 (-) Transcript_5196:4361-5227(-)
MPTAVSTTAATSMNPAAACGTPSTRAGSAPAATGSTARSSPSCSTRPGDAHPAPPLGAAADAGRLRGARPGSAGCRRLAAADVSRQAGNPVPLDREGGPRGSRGFLGTFGQHLAQEAATARHHAGRGALFLVGGTADPRRQRGRHRPRGCGRARHLRVRRRHRQPATAHPDALRAGPGADRRSAALCDADVCLGQRAAGRYRRDQPAQRPHPQDRRRLRPGRAAALARPSSRPRRRFPPGLRGGARPADLDCRDDRQRQQPGLGTRLVWPGRIEVSFSAAAAGPVARP